LRQQNIDCFCNRSVDVAQPLFEIPAAMILETVEKEWF
jgi:hypothetical protein